MTGGVTLPQPPRQILLGRMMVMNVWITMQDGPAMLGIFGVPKDLKGDPLTVIGIKDSEERGLEGVRNY